MNLLLDIGNTRIKVGYADHSGHRDPTLSAAFIHSELDHLTDWLKQHALRPQQALGVSVAAPELTEQVDKILHRFDCSTKWLDGTSLCPILSNGYEAPERLGADRWLGLIGVLTQQNPSAHRPLVHVSFGTATTVDTILPATSHQPARFVGGLILPGPQLMYDALALNTAKLGKGIGTINEFPTNTRSAISSGIAAAQTGAVLRQWQLAQQDQQVAPLLVYSGGGAELIKAELLRAYRQQLNLLNLDPESALWQPTPVLDGLAYMATQKEQTD